MINEVFKNNKIHSGLLYYSENSDMLSDVFIKKHNEVLASPRIVIADLKKLGRSISRKNVCGFLDSYGFNGTDKRVVLSVLKQEKRL